MFRALLCMTLAGETLSFTKWVAKLRSQPLFAALAGFAQPSPGGGTFYDFAARLYPEPTDPIIRQAISQPKKEPAPKPYRAPRSGVVQQLVNQALKNQDKPRAAFPA